MAFSTLPKTFPEIRSYLITKISNKFPAIGAFLENSFIVIFVDVVAYGIEMFMELSTNIFNELHLPTAIQFENVRIKAQFFGYKAHWKVSSKGTVLAGLDAGLTLNPLENITFNKFDRLQINGIDFLVEEDTIFQTSETSVTLPVIQGKLITINNTAVGDQSEEFLIEDSDIENSTFIAEVDGTPYTLVDSFFKSTESSTDFTIEPLANLSGLTAIFGDGFNGRQLESGETVVLKYIQTESLTGQVKSVGFNVTFVEEYQYTDTTVVDIFGTNNSKLIGADSAEDIRSLKFYGQKATSSIENKAFQDDEIKVELQEFGGIALSKSLSEFDVNPETPDFTRANRIQLMILLTSGEALSNALKASIRTYLRTRMDFTDFVEFIPTEFIDIRFVISMEAIVSAPQDLDSQIDSFLQAEYAAGLLAFGVSLNHSSVNSKISTEFVDSIIRFNTTLQVVEEDSSGTVPVTLTRTLLLGDLVAAENNIKVCTIEFTYTSTAPSTGTSESIISDDAGVFSVVGGGISEVIDSGTIDRITGEVVLNIKNDVDTLPLVRFIYESHDSTDKDLNIDVKFNHIIRYKESSSTIEFK
jgi:hypothetical protein